jgi:hypothetical protein
VYEQEPRTNRLPIPTPTRTTLTNVIGFMCLVTTPLWLYFLLFPLGYDYANGIAVFMVVVIIDGVLILHVTRGDLDLRKIMAVGFFLKMFSASAYLTYMLRYYHGGDFMFYFEQGSNIAASLINNGELGHIVGLSSHETMNGTVLTHIITGGLFVVTGPTMSGAVVVF